MESNLDMPFKLGEDFTVFSVFEIYQLLIQFSFSHLFNDNIAIPSLGKSIWSLLVLLELIVSNIYVFSKTYH